MILLLPVKTGEATRSHSLRTGRPIRPVESEFFFGEVLETILCDVYLLGWEIFHGQREIEKQSRISVLRQGNLA
jgi:hypothetical protein